MAVQADSHQRKLCLDSYFGKCQWINIQCKSGSKESVNQKLVAFISVVLTSVINQPNWKFQLVLISRNDKIVLYGIRSAGYDAQEILQDV